MNNPSRALKKQRFVSPMCLKIKQPWGTFVLMSALYMIYVSSGGQMSQRFCLIDVIRLDYHDMRTAMVAPPELAVMSDSSQPLAAAGDRAETVIPHDMRGCGQASPCLQCQERLLDDFRQCRMNVDHLGHLVDGLAIFHPLD